MSKSSKNIVLIGFMGSGKTTVAQSLSKKLPLEYIEADALVLQKSKRKSINEIHDKDGEKRFRELEIEISKEIGTKKGCVVSTGGGAVMNKLNIDYLKNNGIVIYLKTSFQEIKKRLLDVTDRPLFRDVGKAQALYNFRKQLYENYADAVVITNGKNINEICEEIIKIIKN